MNRWSRLGRRWVIWGVGMIGLWGQGVTDAQDLSVTSPQSIEFYRDAADDKASVLVPLVATNVGDQPMTLSVSLIDPQGKPVGQAKLDASQLPADETRTFSARLTPETIKPGVGTPWSGYLQVKSAVKPAAPGTNGTERVSLPVQIYNQQAALFNRPWFFWGPVLLALACVLLATAWLCHDKIHAGRQMEQAKFNPSESWVSNFTVLTSLGSALVALVSFDGPNKIMFATATAVSAALIALAPLVYGLLLPWTAEVTTAGVPAKVKTGPVWGYLVVSLISIAAGAGAFNLLLNLIPRVSQPLITAHVNSNAVTVLTSITYLGFFVLLVTSVVAIVDTVKTQVEDLPPTPAALHRGGNAAPLAPAAPRFRQRSSLL